MANKADRRFKGNTLRYKRNGAKHAQVPEKSCVPGDDESPPDQASADAVPA